MAGPGRNDPCLCGSGRKFKHCCLSRAQAATGITPQDRTTATEALVKYSRRDEFTLIVTQSARRWMDMPNAGTHEALEAIFDFETSTEAFFEWLSFDVRLEDGRTLSEWFLDARGWTVPARVADYIRLMRGTHWRLYHVRDVTPDRGLTVRDLWTKADLFLTERLGSRQLVKWDVLAARVRQHADGTHQIEGCVMALPPAAAKPLLRRLRAEYKSFTARYPDESLAEFFKFAAPHIHDCWLDVVALREPPTLVTRDGEPLTLSTLVFDVPKAGEALVRLLEQPDFEPGDLGCAVWFDGAGNDRLVLGDVPLR